MASSLRSIFSQVGNLLSQLPLALTSAPAPAGVTNNVVPYEPLSGAPSCPIDGPVSCHNNTPVAGDTCCFVHPGGRMLLTQFWDTHVHAGGAEEDWTLHGLWCVYSPWSRCCRGLLVLSLQAKTADSLSSRERPDLCDGTYDQFCHMTPSYSNITEVLHHHGQHELVKFMDRYWLANAYGSRLFPTPPSSPSTC